MGKARRFAYAMAETGAIAAMAWRYFAEEKLPGVALGIVALALMTPLWCVSVPGMPDYPAHLASFWLIGGGASSFYHLQWLPIPNLASEAIVPLLARWTGLDMAARLFLSAGVAMWVLGPGLVQRALTGRIGIAPLLGAFFAYNANFFWGFFNYYFAAGLSLLVFAAWVGTDGGRGTARTIAFAVAVTAVYFCHLFAALSLLAMIAGYEIPRGGHRLLHRMVGVILICLPSALAFLLLKPATAGDHGAEFHLSTTMLDRFDSLILHHFDSPAHALPLLLGTALLLALLTGRARIVPAMLPVLALLALGMLLAPEIAMGGWGVDLRLPALFAALLFASTRTQIGPRLAIGVTIAAVTVAGWTSLTLARNWRAYDRQVTEFRATLPALPRDTRLLTVLDGEAIGWASDPPYWHMAELAIIGRGALTGLLFTTQGQHVVRVNTPQDRFTAATAQQGSPPDIGELDDLAAGRVSDADIRDVFPYLIHFQCHYDEALVIHLGGRRDRIPGMLTLRHQGSFFSLYAIHPDTACARR